MKSQNASGSWNKNKSVSTNDSKRVVSTPLIRGSFKKDNKSTFAYKGTLLKDKILNVFLLLKIYLLAKPVTIHSNIICPK